MTGPQQLIVAVIVVFVIAFAITMIVLNRHANSMISTNKKLVENQNALLEQNTQHKISLEDLEWVNFKGDNGNFNLEPGKGYLYARKTSGEFTLTGTPYSGNGVIELDYDSNANEFAGWNLLGNPYDYNVSVDKAFYVMNEEGTEITPADEGMPIMPMQGFFVVATEEGQTVTFSEWEAPFVPLDKLVMNLTNKRGATIDRAIVRFDEGHQLPKFQLNKNHTKVFIPQEGKDYAIVNVGRDAMHCISTEMPVSFKAEKNGSYTLSFAAQEVSFDYLHLIDNLTGNDVDLLANPSYTFEANTTDYAQRFKLVFAINDEDNKNNKDNFAFISNDEIIVNGEGMLQMFDVTGRTVYAAEVNSAFRIPNSAFTSGVYVLQLVNGDQVKTQKIVVK